MGPDFIFLPVKHLPSIKQNSSLFEGFESLMFKLRKAKKDSALQSEKIYNFAPVDSFKREALFKRVFYNLNQTLCH